MFSALLVQEFMWQRCRVDVCALCAPTGVRPIDVEILCHTPEVRHRSVSMCWSLLRNNWLLNTSLSRCTASVS